MRMPHVAYCRGDLSSLSRAPSAPTRNRPTAAPARSRGRSRELLFGRNIGGRLGVSEAQWGRFVDREISPRFPDGLTVLDAKGEWRDTARNTIVHEPSKLVEIVLPGKDDDAAARGDRAGL